MVRKLKINAAVSYRSLQNGSVRFRQHVYDIVVPFDMVNSKHNPGE